MRSDPGAFMDRALMEDHPFRVLRRHDARRLRGWGLRQGYIYVRAEYPLAVKRLQERYQAGPEAERCWAATSQARPSASRSRSGSALGAFVCGEETALIASIEAGRGHAAPTSALSGRVRA